MSARRLLIPADVAERAVEWLVELQSPEATADLREQWQDWRAAHPTHELAWQRIESINGKLRHLASPSAASAAHAALELPHSRKRRRTMQAFVVMAIGGGVLTARQYTPWREWTADVRSEIGRRRSVMLDDGTALTLNSDSAVDVRYTDTERKLVLLKGEVLIATAQDPMQRPLFVVTAQGISQALGTRFTVRQLDATTQLAVYESAVRVSPKRAEIATLVQAGKRIVFTDRAVGSQLDADAVDIAWSQGMLVAKGMRLRDFLTELDRHTPDALSCTSDIADLRVSGSYPLDDVDEVLQALVEMFELHQESVTRLWGQRSVRLRKG